MLTNNPNIDSTNQISSSIPFKRKWRAICLFSVLLVLLLGVMLGATYQNYFDTSIQNNNIGLVFSISDHQCSLNIDNAFVSYDNKGLGDNSGKTIVQITPQDSAAYTYPNELTVSYNSSPITPTVDGNVLTYTASTTTICTYNKSTGVLSIINSAVASGDLDISGSSLGRPCLISYDLQGGSAGTGSANPTSATYGLEAPTLNNLPEKVGYTFNGFYSAANGKGVLVYDSTGASVRLWDIPTSTTLYAYWKPNQYTVTFDNRHLDASGLKHITVEYGQPMPSIVLPTWGVVPFIGYFSDKSANDLNKYYNADGTSAKNYDLLADVTLYASWGRLLRMQKPADATGMIYYSSSLGGAVVGSAAAVSGETSVDIMYGIGTYYVWVVPTANTGYASIYTSNANASTCYTVTLSNADDISGNIFVPIRSQLSDYSWAEIKAIAQAAIYTDALGNIINTVGTAGTNSSMYKIYNFRQNDTKVAGSYEDNSITYYTTMRITDMKKGRYAYSSGSASTNIVFETTTCVVQDAMNTTRTNAGGWGSTDLRTTINGNEFMTTYFNDVKDYLVNVTVLSGPGGKVPSSTPVVTVDNNKLFLGAQFEIYGINNDKSPWGGDTQNGADCFGEAGVCGQFEYYNSTYGAGDGGSSSNQGRLKSCNATNNVNWWMRSPKTVDTNINFRRVGNGTAKDQTWSSESDNLFGVSPFFAF